MSPHMAAPDIAERLAEHRRLCLLRALAEDPAGRLRRDLLTVLALAEGSANLSLLTDCLVDLDHPVSRDQVHTAAAWCVAQGLAVPQPDGDIPGWHLTDAGGEAASGRTVTPGIAPPATCEWLVMRLSQLSVKTHVAQLLEDWVWFEERGLAGHGLPVTSAISLLLTKRGAEVAAGRLVVEGVKKPSYAAMLNAAAAVGKSILGG